MDSDTEDITPTGDDDEFGEGGPPIEIDDDPMPDHERENLEG